MAIYVGENNALMLKSDRSVVELYKGEKKLFGYNNSVQGEIIAADNVHPIEHKLKVKLTSDTITDFSNVNVIRCGKNFFDADTVLPSLRNPSFTAQNQCWVKQDDGSFYLFNIGILKGYKWFENTKGYNGQMAISITTKSRIENIDETADGFQVSVAYTDGTTAKILCKRSEDYITYTLVTNAEKTVDYIYQAVSATCGVYIKNIMIAYGNDSEYEPYNPQIAISNSDGTVEGLTSLSPDMTIFSDSTDAVINISYC